MAKPAPRVPPATRAALAAVGAAALGGALVLLATRHDPMLSPDSIAYLSAADHLRGGHGLTDFTGEPLTVFGPVFPLLLAPGGRGLAWASTVTALAVTVSTLLLYALLRGRVRPWVAAGAALAFATAQGVVRVGSTVWSEMPYTAIALATMVLLCRDDRIVTHRRAAIAGVLAGLGFLTRYAGAGLVLTGAVVVAVAADGPGLRGRMRAAGVFAAASALTVGPWVLRNLVRTGEPLGPRFEGGSTDPWATLWQHPLAALGELFIGPRVATPTRAGTVVVVALAAGVVAVAAQALLRRGPRRVDVAMAAFAVTSYVVPVVARAVTSNDIEYRVMSPMLVPMVYLAAVVADALARWRVGRGVAIASLALWGYQGLTTARTFPDGLGVSAGSRTLYAPDLYDAFDALGTQATVLTNNPHRVWWQTGREPTLFAFTRPRPGNSHYPVGLERTLRLACGGDTHLAWFAQLANAGQGPAERRPDLLAVVDLTVEHQVPGGTLYLVTPLDPAACGAPTG